MGPLGVNFSSYGCFEQRSIPGQNLTIVVLPLSFAFRKLYQEMSSSVLQPKLLFLTNVTWT